VIVLAMVLVLAAPNDPPPAAPVDDTALAEAKARFAEGKAAYDLGHFDDALAAFEAAYTAKPLPGFLFNLGQCHFGLGHYERAVFFYERYLELLPSAPNKELVDQLIAEAKAKDAETRAAASTAARPTMPTTPPPPPAPDEGTPWLLIGGAAGAVAVVAAGVIAAVILTQPQPPASTLGTLDRRNGS
jgi:tetratricopeptide (TPR) repeat protein